MGYDVLTTGYISLDHVIKISNPAKVGFTSLIVNKNHFGTNYGGCPVNIAAALNKLGKKTMPIIRVGEDFEAVGFKNFFSQNHIPMEGIMKIDKEQTSSSYLIEDQQGNHITLFYPGAMNEKYCHNLDNHLFTNVRLAIMTVGPMSDNRNFFEMCRKNHIPLVLGMKLDLVAFPAHFLKEVIEYAKIIFTNTAEKEEIERILDYEITKLFDEGNAEIIVTTCGRKGSIYYEKCGNGYTRGTVPAYSRVHIVDTTGSGDAYLSGFIYGYLNHYKASACAELGATLASFVLESDGCCTNLPNVDQLLQRYAYYLGPGNAE